MYGMDVEFAVVVLVVGGIVGLAAMIIESIHELEKDD